MRLFAIFTRVYSPREILQDDDESTMITKFHLITRARLCEILASR